MLHAKPRLKIPISEVKVKEWGQRLIHDFSASKMTIRVGPTLDTRVERDQTQRETKNTGEVFVGDRKLALVGILG